MERPNEECDVRNLTRAQQNIVAELVKHKSSVLNHQDQASIFRQLAIIGTSFPKYTRPAIALRDIKFYSTESRSRFKIIVHDFQKHFCDLLADHHKDPSERSKKVIKLRLETVARVYKDKKLIKSLNNISKIHALNSHTEH